MDPPINVEKLLRDIELIAEVLAKFLYGFNQAHRLEVNSFIDRKFVEAWARYIEYTPRFPTNLVGNGTFNFELYSTL